MGLPTIPFEAYRERARTAREVMEAHGFDALLACPSVNLRYITGCALRPSQRFLALLFRKEAIPVMVVPVCEREGILESPLKMETLLWRDGEDPYERLRQLIGGATGLTIALEPRTDFTIYMNLVRAIPEVRWMDGTGVFDRLREDGGEAIPFDWPSWRGRVAA